LAFRHCETEGITPEAAATLKGLGFMVEHEVASTRGLLGRGLPLIAPARGGSREIHDGAGLCSPGRWAPEARRYPTGVTEELCGLLAASLPMVYGTGDFKNLVFKLAAGKQTTSPFTGSEVEKVRGEVVDLLNLAGHPTSRRTGDRDQKIHIRLLQALLRAAGDPDADYLDQVAVGVRLGVGVDLGRAPAIFEEKLKWTVKEEFGDPDGTERENYVSATRMSS
jgi:hypothetical protein